jgi:hypothetical protein
MLGTALLTFKTTSSLKKISAELARELYAQGGVVVHGPRERAFKKMTLCVYLLFALGIVFCAVAVSSALSSAPYFPVAQPDISLGITSILFIILKIAGIVLCLWKFGLLKSPSGERKVKRTRTNKSGRSNPHIRKPSPGQSQLKHRIPGPVPMLQLRGWMKIASGACPGEVP